MEYRKVGKTELEVSLIGLGCNRIASAESQSHAREIEMTLRAALDRGITLFDTADIYGGGESERILGRVLGNRRSEVNICTKAGLRSGAARRFAGKVTPRIVRRVLRLWGPPAERPKLGRGTALKRNFDPAYIEEAIGRSLRRLRTDYLDLFMLHSPPREIISESGLFETLARLKHAGIVRCYGVSLSDRSTSDDAIAFLEAEGLSVLQIMVNPERTMDVRKIVPFLTAKGVGLIAREPFARGRIFSNRALHKVVADSGIGSMAQMAIRATVGMDGVTSVVVGMRSRTHLEENISALSIPPLSPFQMERLYASAEFL